MIDLHSHILFGFDDGATDIAMSLEMARRACEDGVEVMACTPHFLPGLYDPSPADVIARVAELNDRLYEEGLDLALVAGCEAHVRPDMVKRLEEGAILPIHRTRHVLCEAPPKSLPPHLDQFFLGMIAAGYTPILAHVERYRWIDSALPWIRNLSARGVVMQVTAGSLLGDYGHRAEYWSHRLLDDCLVDIVASDAHNLTRRPPGLAGAFEFVTRERGAEEAIRMFKETPAAILLGGNLERGIMREAS